MQNASIVDVLGQYPGLKWKDWPDPSTRLRRASRSMSDGQQADHGYRRGRRRSRCLSAKAPTVSSRARRATKQGIGAGDGVMITGDVRTLARSYCAKGTTVHYKQYNALSHVWSLVPWLPNSIAWIKQRFADLPAPQNCSSMSRATSSIRFRFH